MNRMERSIKEAIADAIKNRQVAGVNILILKDHQEIFYHEDGFADLEAGKPIRRDTVFRLYSMTKPITATAVMLLVEEGKLDLLEPVATYLEGFRDQFVYEGDRKVPVTREMNIKDLMDMTSGLVYGGDHKTGQETGKIFEALEARILTEQPMTTLEFANRLGKCGLLFQPGTSWEYGTSADVLGAIVEVVSGVTFGAFLKERLFEPLDMQDTGFMAMDAVKSRLAKVYHSREGRLDLYTGNNLGILNPMDRVPAFESGGAGLVSTLDDYAKFANMLMAKGEHKGVRLLERKTVEYLSSVTLQATQQAAFKNWHTLSGHSYGNLMRVVTDASQTASIACQGEYGWDGWLGCYFANLPKEKVSLLMMMQKVDSGTWSLTRKIRNIVNSNLG